MHADESGHHVNHPPSTRPLSKGILSFITGRGNDSQNGSESSFHLLHFPRNLDAIKMKRIIRKEKVRSSSSGAEGSQNVSLSCGSKPYHPSDATITLIYFCELDCANSRRFTFILANFLKDLFSCDEDSVQLLCVLNEDIRRTKARKIEDGSIISHLQSETELWHLGYDHINRLSLLRMLSITRVPSLVVVDNKSGRVITPNGMEAVEWCGEGNASSVLASWKNGDAAVPLVASCIMS